MAIPKQKDHIYVNLELPASEPRWEDDYYLDESKLVVDCSDNTNIGSLNNPLTCNEFRNYLVRSDFVDIPQTFHLKGTRDFRDTSFNDVFVYSSLYPSSTNVTNKTRFILSSRQEKITITNWEESELSTSDIETYKIQDPWKIIWTDDVYNYEEFCMIRDIEFLNGEIEVINNESNTNNLKSFKCFGRDTENTGTKNIVFNNMKVLVDVKYMSPNYNSHAITLGDWQNINVINSIFHNKDTTGTFSEFDDNTSAGFILLNSRTNINFFNSIFTGFNSFWRTKDSSSVYFRVQSCVFSETRDKINKISEIDAWGGGTTITSPYQNLFSNTDINTNIKNSQFGFDIPSILSAGIDTLTQSDFYYLSDDWYGGNLSVPGTQSFPVFGPQNINIQESFGRRDGVGPLVFPELFDFDVVVDPVPSEINQEISVTISYYDEIEEVTKSVEDYQNTFQPSSFQFKIDGTLKSKVNSLPFTYTYSKSGTDKIECNIFSHNEWYSESNFVNHIINIPDGEIEITLYKVAYIDGNPIYEEVTSASVLDEILVSATHINTSVDNGTLTFSSFSYDFSEKNTITERTINNGNFLSVGGSFNRSTRYLIPGNYTVYVKATQVDGKVIVASKSIDIQPKVSNEYYVDLSLDGEITGNTFIEDDFTDGINENWNDTFKDNYDVVDMFGNSIAIDNDFQERRLISNIERSGFNTEFSFYRNERFDIPEFNIYRTLQSPNNLIKISWDYNNNQIRIIYRAFSGATVKVKDIQYDIPIGFVKDLRCPNSLRELHFKIENKNNNFIIKYSFDKEKWEDIVTETGNWSMLNQNMNIEVKTSNTVGFNYINLQSNGGLPFEFGTPENPFSYQTFKRRIESTVIDDYDVNVGKHNDIYRCKNYRILIQELLVVNRNKYFEITSWYDSKDPEEYRELGPWMLIIHNMSRFYQGQMKPLLVVSFRGCKISNGIIYNKSETSNNLNSTNNLLLSFAYNMFIVWKGFNSSIRLLHSRWLDREYIYREIVGSTIKTNANIRGR